MMTIRFEGDNVVANWNGMTVVSGSTPRMETNGIPMNPFQLFLFAVGNCEGVFMQMFYAKHGLSLNDAGLNIDLEFHEDGKLKKSTAHILIGKNFPEDKQKALVAMLKGCKVKKHLKEDIEFEYLFA